MQHNVTDTVLSSFSQLRTGERWQSPLGLTVCELIDDRASPRARRMSRAPSAGLEWREMDPPQPRRVRVRNREPTVAMVEAGAVLTGGMGVRAMRSCMAIAAGADVTVAVEPLGARWWGEGPLRQSGRLEPVAMALLFQATLAMQPLASSAAAALSSLSPLDAVTGPRAPESHTATGWLLEGDDGIVGGWILDHAPVAPPRPVLAWHHDLCAPEAAPLRLLLALEEDIEYGALEAHLVDHGNGGHDLVLLPRGVCLADRAGGLAVGGRR